MVTDPAAVDLVGVMILLRGDIPGRRFPIVNVALIAANFRGLSVLRVTERRTGDPRAGLEGLAALFSRLAEDLTPGYGLSPPLWRSLSATRPAWLPHIPCAPGPGGVAAEQMYMPGTPV
jgi:hypothetical protein